MLFLINSLAPKPSEPLHLDLPETYKAPMPETTETVFMITSQESPIPDDDAGDADIDSGSMPSLTDSSNMPSHLTESDDEAIEGPLRAAIAEATTTEEALNSFPNDVHIASVPCIDGRPGLAIAVPGSITNVAGDVHPGLVGRLQGAHSSTDRDLEWMHGLTDEELDTRATFEGVQLTHAQFMMTYGHEGQEKWDLADEQRLAMDNQMYTLAEFNKWYGEEDAYRMWDAAGEYTARQTVDRWYYYSHLDPTVAHSRSFNIYTQNFERHVEDLRSRPTPSEAEIIEEFNRMPIMTIEERIRSIHCMGLWTYKHFPTDAHGNVPPVGMPPAGEHGNVPPL